MQENKSTMESSKTKVIAFVGSEKYDLIIFLASVVLQLNQTVLLVDLSEDGGLSEAMQDSEVSQNEITQPCIMDYRGIHYIPRFEHWQTRVDILWPYLFHENQDYDYVLVDLGFQVGHTVLTECNLILSVSDMHRHNYIRLRSLAERKDVEQLYILRDVIKCKINLMEIMPKNLQEQGKTVILDFSLYEYLGRIQMQYSKQIYYKRITGQIQELITRIVRILDPELTEDELSTAIIRGKRGR